MQEMPPKSRKVQLAAARKRKEEIRAAKKVLSATEINKVSDDEITDDELSDDSEATEAVS